MIKKYLKLSITPIILLVKTFFTSIGVLANSRFFIEIRSIKVKNGSKCYILGNGPSLKEDLLNNLNFLQTQDLFVVNDFAKSEYYEILKPKYYVFADPCYWSTSVYKDFYENGILILHKICEKTDWPLYIFIPNQAFKTKVFQSIFSQNKNIILIAYNTTSNISGFEKANYFFYKNYLGMPPSQNVLIVCIYLAITMKFCEVNILGADHTWTQGLIVNEKNEVCHSDSHFYDEGKVKYIPFRNISGELYKMHEILKDYARMFEGYHILRKYGDYMNIKIFNRCSNSFIDAFEKKLLNDR